MSETKKRFKMPTSYTIVFFALVITAILSYVVPQSVFDKEAGSIVFNAAFGEHGEIIRGVGLRPFGFWDVLMAPIQGFQAASDVAIGILCAGGFLNVLNHVGALDAGIGRILERFEGNVLIAVMMFIFAVLGTSFGFWEEITAFSVVIVPMFVLAGYDVMTGLGVLFIGATIGNMSSLVNPFSTGAAVAAIGNPDLTIGSGIVLRSIIFLALYVVGTMLMIRYASRVKKNPEKSVLADCEGVNTLVDKNESLPEFTTQRKWSALVLILIVVVIILGYFPWEEIAGVGVANAVNSPFTALAKVPVLGSILGAGHVSRLGTWGFNEFAFLFVLGAFLLKFINKMSETEFLDVFIDGMKDLFGVVVVLAIARGIAIIMGSSSEGMSITFIYWISGALSAVPTWVFGLFAIASYVLIGVFLQSTSGVAGISMPILGAVASAVFAASAIGESGGQIILISAFVAGINFMAAIYPSATLMGTLEFVNVPYDKYLKFTLRILSVLLIVAAVIISVASAVGFVK
ncbi:YfcC family protein [Erysipelothrix rhusiopathiae]|uniref:YfcC family protein n=1 Tax=Erysipelothrix rhusiopathiae TaxID=1648 RepID=UPI001EDD72B9|nr:YfcC family protein [Erysipelothrix rhusiopathiae]MCG4457297.1 YfcC family protein [Erysipelothrix rhusiopathiae]MDE8143180.1 YfcC family protein [Erysipelothrix rhusiopathiae]MDE8334186.1 YfcC family protein [Erysipelothrix rhusiopathiae]